MNIIDDNVMVCTDCIMVIANGDYTGLDSIDGEIVPGDSEYDREFSKAPCECCGSILAGYRHHCVILG